MKITIPPSRYDRLLTVCFAVLLAIQVLYPLIGFASIPSYYHRVTTQTVASVVYYGEVQISDELVAQMASERGLSLTQYAVYRIVLSMAAALIPLTIAALIVRRARAVFGGMSAHSIMPLDGMFQRL